MPRLNALEDRTDGSQGFGLTNYDNLQADLDYLVVAGDDIAAIGAGNTLTVTSSFHTVTAAAGTVDAITDALGESKGQPVELLFQNQQTIRDESSGNGGNVKTLTGQSRTAHPGEIIRFVYDGTYWREVRPAPGARIAYGITGTPVATNATSFATGVDLLAAPLNFTADGVSDYVLHVSAGYLLAGTAAYSLIVEANLDGVSVARVARWTPSAAGIYAPLGAACPISAPAAGAHTLNARFYMSGATSGYIDPSILVSVEVA